MRTDEDLLRRVARGEGEALLELYRRHQADLFRFAWHMTGSRQHAEEVVQETFLLLWRKPDAYQEQRGAPRAFLFGVARNLTRRDARAFEEVPEDLAIEDDLLADMSAAERIGMVRDAVRALPEVYREAVVLCDMEEMSYGEASRVLGCPVGTVRSRVSRGRALLAAKLRARVS